MKRAGFRLLGWRWVAVGFVVALAAAVAAMSAGVTASRAAPRVARSVRLAPRSALGLSRTPAGLRAAVRRTLGTRAASDPWSLQAELTASHQTPFDEFGASVAVSGDTAVVGAAYKHNGTGAAYVFVRSGSSWHERAVLTARGGTPFSHFGHAVGISGNTVVVGAPSHDDYRGAVYVFVKPSSGWANESKPPIAEGSRPHEHSFDQLGYSVGISGNTVVAGAPGRSAAFVFVRSHHGWSQRAELTNAHFGAFGSSVAISGDTVVVGAPYTGEGGAVYVFVHRHRRWSLQQELTASHQHHFDELGSSVAISGDTAVVGDPFKSRGEFTFEGAAYVFVRSHKAWSQQQELTALPSLRAQHRFDWFGYSVAVSGDTAVVGAPGKNLGKGAAYVFARSGKKWSQRAELTVPAPTGPTVFLGYADTVRRRPSHPSPWQGSANVVFKGCNYFRPGRCPKAGGRPVYDAGAIRLDNETLQHMILTNASVKIGSCTFRPWPGLHVDLKPGKELILTQTGGKPQCPGNAGKGENFDTSDAHQFGHECTLFNELIPVVRVTVDGVKHTYEDFAQILNTFGVDFAHCGHEAAITEDPFGSTWLPLEEAGGLGHSVGISGETALIGAPWKARARGAAYVFVHSAPPSAGR